MKISYLAIAALSALALLAPAVADAQQHVPSNIGAGGAAVMTQPSSPIVAPAGGGEGTGRPVAEDSPLPTGGVQVSIVVTPTVTASSAYATGNNLGTIQTLTGAVRLSGGTALLQKVVLNFKSAQTAQTDVLIFNASPSGSTFTDKTAVSVATADFDKLVGVVHVADCTSAGTPTICQATGLALSVKAVGTANLYAVAVTRGTPTFTATTDVSMNLVFIQD